jgi:hypothetical protein
MPCHQAEYFYAGAGSRLVPPTNATAATPTGDPALWAAWMAELDPSLAPRIAGHCGGGSGATLGPVRGYEGRLHLHEGFGFYQPNFMVRNMLGTCGCPLPFDHLPRAPSGGDCWDAPGAQRGPRGAAPAARTYLAVEAGPASGKGYPAVGPAELAEAKRVLEAFDAVVPTERLDHPSLPRFLLWHMGWLVDDDTGGSGSGPGGSGTGEGPSEAVGDAGTGKGKGVGSGSVGGLGHVHSYAEEQAKLAKRDAKRDAKRAAPTVQSVSTARGSPEKAGVTRDLARGRRGAAATPASPPPPPPQQPPPPLKDPRSTPPCIRAALAEQNALESELHAWALRRFDAEMARFEARASAI